MRDFDVERTGMQRATPGLGYQVTPYQGRRELVREIDHVETYDDDMPVSSIVRLRPPMRNTARLSIPPVPTVSQSTLPS